MNSPRSFKSFSSVVWYSDSGSIQQNLVDHLQQNGFEVEVSLSEEDLKSKFLAISPTFFVIDHPANFSRAVQLVASGKKHLKDSAFTSILLSANLSADEKEQYFTAEGDELLLAPLSPKELLCKALHYQAQHKTRSEISLQLEEASQMALLAMENSSDSGGILNFVKEAMNSKSYDELASKIFSATHPYCDTAIVEIKGLDNFYYFSSNNEVDEDMKRFLRAQKNDERVVQSDSLLQVNNQNLVILLDGVPLEDQSKMGRISDTLVMLCDAANRYVESIAIEENLNKADESRRRFLTTLSHELRTPLNGILGFSKTLSGRNQDAPIGSTGIYALEKIVEGTNQINAIITTLIEISGSSLGTNELDKRDIDIKHLISRIETRFKESAEEKGLALDTTYPEGLSLFSEEKKVSSMLEHLVDNAIKFTKSGEVSIAITTDFDPDMGKRIVFKVSDTGIGIDAKDHQRIFSELGQLNNEHNREHYGVGLGLYYVNLLSQQLGGKVTVESSLGSGSTFTLCLPCTDLNEQNEQDAKSQAQEIDDLLF